MVNIRLRQLWQESAALTGTAVVMLITLVFSLAGVLLDPRTVGGAPVWMKPVKFAISTGIFCGTMAWLFRYLQVWTRTVRICGWVMAGASVIEVAIIDLQAWRGTTSHFNTGSFFDALMFAVMGIAILMLWIALVVVLAALFRQRFEDAAWGWWLRMGVLTLIIGSASGGLMTRPSPEQVNELRTNRRVPAVGGHTVGGQDGGPGLSGVGWSTEHGDLRIAHFVGLHGVQVLPLLGWVLRRRRSSALAILSGVGYLELFGILLWQALRGQSIVNPDGATLAAFGIWLAAAGFVFFWPARSYRAVSQEMA